MVNRRKHDFTEIQGKVARTKQTYQICEIKSVSTGEEAQADKPSAQSEEGVTSPDEEAAVEAASAAEEQGDAPGSPKGEVDGEAGWAAETAALRAVVAAADDVVAKIDKVKMLKFAKNHYVVPYMFCFYFPVTPAPNFL